MSAYSTHTSLWKRFLSLPKTGLGWWSVGMTATSLVLLIFGVLVFEVLVVDEPWEGVIGAQAITMFLSGLAGGVLGLIAVVRSHERSALVWLAMVLGPAPALPFIVQYLLYLLNSPWYSP
jgi:hypothetical protein